MAAKNPQKKRKNFKIHFWLAMIYTPDSSKRKLELQREAEIQEEDLESIKAGVYKVAYSPPWGGVTIKLIGKKIMWGRGRRREPYPFPAWSS